MDLKNIYKAKLWDASQSEWAGRNGKYRRPDDSDIIFVLRESNDENTYYPAGTVSRQDHTPPFHYKELKTGQRIPRFRGYEDQTYGFIFGNFKPTWPGSYDDSEELPVTEVVTAMQELEQYLDKETSTSIQAKINDAYVRGEAIINEKKSAAKKRHTAQVVEQHEKDTLERRLSDRLKGL